jgi:hypothetical protein
VPRFEQSSRGKQINPSSPQLIKADAPSVREREVAGSGTFSRANFSSHSPSARRRQSAAQFFCARAAVPDQHYKYSTVECERESRRVYFLVRARGVYIYSESRNYGPCHGCSFVDGVSSPSGFAPITSRENCLSPQPMGKWQTIHSPSAGSFNPARTQTFFNSRSELV